VQRGTPWHGIARSFAPRKLSTEGMRVIPVQTIGRKLRALPMSPAPATGPFDRINRSGRLWASSQWRVLAIGRRQ